MLDARHTTADWQAHATDILVLPVGAFEQHGDHLPLDTDSILAEAFAQPVAEALDAALLPTLRIATSLEQSGFRGTFSLQPETLMQVVRDLAAEAAGQGFRILVVVNGHGGNHALVPVCRDLNRRDGPLKIILVDWWDFCPPELLARFGCPGPDIHAGAMETSLMLALRPDLVRGPGRDLPPAAVPAAIPLGQKDLTTFGVGQFNPAGPAGFPSRATKAAGEALTAAVRERLVAFVRDRVARLRAQRRYAGAAGLTLRQLTAAAAGLTLRQLTPADLPDLMRLKTLVGWNQTETDCRWLTANFPAGNFVVTTAANRVVASTITVAHGGQVAWIGMVIVDPEFRRLGLATRMVEAAVAAARGCAGVGLDASPDGREVYQRLGFKAVAGLHRFAASGATASPTAGQATPVVPADLPALVALDQAAFGAEREPLLRYLLARRPDYAFKIVRGGKVCGFCLGRDGAAAEQIGPVVAETAADAMALLAAALPATRGRPVQLDVPDTQTEWVAALRQAGFAEQRAFTRMYVGAPPNARRPATLFAVAGPELG